MNPDYKNKILSFYKKHKRMPGYKEMMEMLRFKSKNAVYKVVNKLVEEGIVSKDSQGRMVPNRIMGEVPLLGLVEAGLPSVAEEESLDTISIDDYLVQKREATYLLEVKGDSMIEEGIKEGDLVIAEKLPEGIEPKDGEVVVAEVDGGWTMKYFRKRNGRVYLEPANKKYKPIYPEQYIKIAAIIVGVVRKY